MTCPRCGSEHVMIQPVTRIKTKRRGCLGWFFWILLAIATFGLILIIPALTNTRTSTKTRMVAVCQNCGKQWKV